MSGPTGAGALRRPRVRRGPGLLLQSCQIASIAYLASVGGLLWWSNAPMLVGWQPRVVLTGSMLPVIRPGDVALVGPGDAHAEGLPPGRIVLVTDSNRESGTYLHRVVRYEKNGFLVTKGDANPTEDHPAVDPDRVRGQVRLLVPAIGRPVVWLHDHRYLLLGGSLALTWLAMTFALALRGRPERADGGADGGADGALDGAAEGPVAERVVADRAVVVEREVAEREVAERPAADQQVAAEQVAAEQVAAEQAAAEQAVAEQRVAEERVAEETVAEQAARSLVLPDVAGPDAVLPSLDPTLDALRALVLQDSSAADPPFVPTMGTTLSADAERLVLDLDAFEAAFGAAFGAADDEDISDFDGRGFDR